MSYLEATRILDRGNFNRSKFLEKYGKFFEPFFYGYINDEVRAKLKEYKKGIISYDKMVDIIEEQSAIVLKEKYNI